MSSVPAPESQIPRPRMRQRVWFIFCVLLLLDSCLVALNVSAWDLWPKWRQSTNDDAEATLPLSFNGSSDKLKQTIVVPTLDSAIPQNKSAIWCATAPMAWQQFEKDIAGGPVVVEGAEAICQSLSKSPNPNLDPKDFYVAAGLMEKGIVEQIRKEMAVKFPDAKLPDLDPIPEGAVTWAYLAVALEYSFHFNDSEKPLEFQDSKGNKTPVQAFGIREQDKDKGENSFRSQVEVLFQKDGAFAVDLSRKTQPYQIILARMDRQPTLASTLADLNKRIAAETSKGLSEAAVLLVPKMHWKIDHEFQELIGNIVTPRISGGKWIKAHQSVQFRMDRKGVVL